MEGVWKKGSHDRRHALKQKPRPETETPSSPDRNLPKLSSHDTCLDQRIVGDQLASENLGTAQLSPTDSQSREPEGGRRPKSGLRRTPLPHSNGFVHCPGACQFETFGVVNMQVKRKSQEPTLNHTALQCTAAEAHIIFLGNRPNA